MLGDVFTAVDEADDSVNNVNDMTHYEHILKVCSKFKSMMKKEESIGTAFRFKLVNFDSSSRHYTLLEACVN